MVGRRQEVRPTPLQSYLQVSTDAVIGMKVS